MTLFPQQPLGMPISLASPPRFTLPALAVLLSLAGPAALAQPAGPNPPPQRLTPEQQQRIFPDQRRLALADHQARIAILQRGQDCLQKATNADALRDCMRTEREAMGQQRRQHMDTLRALYERNGLPAPQWKQRRGWKQGPLPVAPGTGT